MRLDGFIQSLKDSKIGRALLAEQEATRRQTRTARIAQIAEIRKQIGPTMKPLCAAEEEMRERVSQAREAYVAAKNEYTRASGQVLATSCRFQNQIARLENELRADADPRVDELVWELRQLEEERRKDPVSLGYSQDAFGEIFVSSTNAPEREKQRLLLRELVHEAEDLLLAELGDGLTARLESIRKRVGLPTTSAPPATTATA
jgi:hypothetical protein